MSRLHHLAIFPLILCAALSPLAQAEEGEPVSTVVAHEEIQENRFSRRAIEAGIWIMPQVMYHQMEEGAFKTFGGDERTIYYYSQPMT